MMEKKPTILIVDDDPDFTQALLATLEAKPYQVVTASNRSQAEAVAKAQRPDAVVLGTIMPRGDAFLFHKWLKHTSRFSDVPILVINAPPEKQLTKGWRMDEGMQCEAEDFLARPGDLAALLPRIQ